MQHVNFKLSIMYNYRFLTIRDLFCNLPFFVSVRADVDNFVYLCSEGYSILKHFPEGNPPVVNGVPIPLTEELHKKYSEFVDKPKGKLWT